MFGSVEVYTLRNSARFRSKQCSRLFHGEKYEIPEAMETSAFLFKFVSDSHGT